MWLHYCVDGLYLQETVGCSQLCPASASSRTFSTALCHPNRASPLQTDMSVLSASSSGGSEVGLMWLLTIVYQPSTADLCSCIRWRKMNSGVLCWRRHMQSLCRSAIIFDISLFSSIFFMKDKKLLWMSYKHWMWNDYEMLCIAILYYLVWYNLMIETFSNFTWN